MHLIEGYTYKINYYGSILRTTVFSNVSSSYTTDKEAITEMQKEKKDLQSHGHKIKSSRVKCTKHYIPESISGKVYMDGDINRAAHISIIESKPNQADISINMSELFQQLNGKNIELTIKML